MRIATLWVLGVFLPLGCGEADTQGGLQQIGDPGLEIRDDDVVAPRPDTSPDVADDTVAPDADTIGPDADTTEPDADTTEPDADTTEPLECQLDDTCPGTTCEAGRCVEGRCTLVPLPDGLPCNDGEVCTTQDQCLGGQCVGAPAVCDDGDACTDNICQPGLGCVFTPVVCDDGDLCTIDSCQPRLGCVFTPRTCGPVSSDCERARCDSELGCVIEPIGSASPCSDGDACTTDDHCEGTVCVGTPRTCDDGNDCTADACAEGGCVFTPIPGCGLSPACEGKLAGQSCDDGDPNTAADMCLLGVCRGFALTRIAGTSVTNQQSLAVIETAYGPDGWSAVYWLADLALRNRFALASLTDPANPAVYMGTLQENQFMGLREGFVGDRAGRLWRFGAGGWTVNNAWDAALAQTGRGAFRDLWVAPATTLASADTGRRMWLVGEADGEAWVRHCVEQAAGVACATQELDEEDAIPKAVAGAKRCNGGVCGVGALVIGADLPASGGEFYNQTYENFTGTAPTWEEGRAPNRPAGRTTRSVAAWGPPTALRAVAAGSQGYLSVRRADGSWSPPLTLKDQQSTRTFSGAWQEAGVVAIAATRRISNSVLAYELWTAPIEGELETGTTWTVHELTRSANVGNAALYDVHLRSTGEARAVGALRREGGIIDRLDGAVWARTP